ncbi:hypothetical protein ACI7BZ_17035 [Xanthobacter sp. AM11]|uniref:hypothetical protein n=1 Tax=Xanthobacter sp. AM11 TaxID=3380643 RepID=UPI0039BFDF4B
MRLAAFDMMMEEWTAAPIIRQTANDNTADVAHLRAEIERDVETFQQETDRWLASMWKRIATLEETFEQMASDDTASARNHAESLLWPAASAMQTRLVQVTTAGDKVRNAFEDAMRDFAQQHPLSADLAQRGALKIAEIGAIQRKARAGMYFHILDLAEKYAPNTRAASIEASVKRTLKSYSVVNDILAR